MTQKKIKIIDLGLVDYNYGILYQKNIHNKTSDNANVILLEHDKVITIGTKGDNNDVLVSIEKLKKEGFSVINSDRGGQVTIHNKGQLVCYIVMPISNYNLKPVDFVRKIESLIINLLKNFDISSYIIKGKTDFKKRMSKMESKLNKFIFIDLKNEISDYIQRIEVDLTDENIEIVMNEVYDRIEYKNKKTMLEYILRKLLDLNSKNMIASKKTMLPEL